MNAWQNFFKTTLLSSLFCLVTYFVVYIFTDPYDRFFTDLNKIPSRPKLNERFFLPSLASKSNFNSVILGTSTIQLLKPKQLNQFFNEKFVNIAMASATAYEQSKLFYLFLKSHPRPDTVIFGIDIIWCQEHCPKNASISHFPEFLFYDNRLCDLKEGLTQRTAKHSLKQLLVLLHLAKPVERSDGYRNFLPSFDKYSLTQARKHIYGQETPLPRLPFPQEAMNSKRQFNFSQAYYMEDMLRSLPPETKKIIIFVPYHSYHQSSGGIEGMLRWRACKQHYKNMALRYANTHVVDFMIESYITEKDENYWDPLHYNLETAEKLGQLIYTALKENKSNAAFLYERSP